MKKSLEELVDLAEAHVRDYLLTKGEKELTPMWHLISRKEKSDAVVATPWGGDFEKQLAVAKVKEIAREIDAEAVCFTTECWMLDSTRIKHPGGPLPNTSWHRDRAMRNMPRPSQSPDRIEAVIIVAHDGVNTKARSLQMIRDRPGGRLISLIDYAPGFGDSVYESWMLKGMIHPEE